MRIITSSHTLDRSGVPTYTLALYNELTRRGHNVLVYSPLSGALAKKMNTVTDLKGIEAPDIILAQHKTCAIKLKNVFPNVPMILITHGIVPEQEQPPRIDIDYYLPVNEQNAENLISQYIDPGKIKIIRDFIDTEEFRPVNPLAEDKPKVLFISNYKKWRAWQDLTKACSILGLEFGAVGAPYGRSRNVAETINNADLVVTWGRGILEAMACGRPAISYNKRMGAGYITPEVYMENRIYNLGGIRSRYTFNLEELMGEIKKYNPEDGVVNRELIMKYHDGKKCVDQIEAVISRMVSWI